MTNLIITESSSTNICKNKSFPILVKTITSVTILATAVLIGVGVFYGSGPIVIAGLTIKGSHLLIGASITFALEMLFGLGYYRSIIRNQPPSNIAANTEITFDNLVNLSDQFAKIHPFPTNNNRIRNLASNLSYKQEVVQFAKETRPILHSRAVPHLDRFLQFKRANGSAKEKALYHNMTREELIDRLITKRPLMFMGETDQYLLRNRATGYNGTAAFDSIGKDHEKTPFTLDQYISYDEMQLSALLGMSTPTHFINSGSRNNRAQSGIPNTFERSGVYIGLVGARFERPGKMEWEHMLITPEQNTPQNGYGQTAEPNSPSYQKLRTWANLYRQGECFPSYQEAIQNQRGDFAQVTRVGNRPVQNTYLNINAYKERMKLTVEAFLLEANQRAKNAGKKAYVHTVGLGLGVWGLTLTGRSHPQLLVDVFAEVVRDNNFAHIADIDFSWFPEGSTFPGTSRMWGTVTDNQQNSIGIHFSKRDPADKLQGKDQGKLLVASYAWDSNSYPGNEYWSQALTASGDPAAACCSFIPELQNPMINPRVSGRFCHFLVRA